MHHHFLYFFLNYATLFIMSYIENKMDNLTEWSFIKGTEIRDLSVKQRYMSMTMSLNCS